MNPVAALTLVDSIDIFAVAAIIYLMMRLMRGTRSSYMITGFFFCFLVYWVAKVAELRTLNWMLEQLITSLVVIIVIIFQHDIRRLLTKVGRSTFASSFSLQGQDTLEEIVKTCVSLANKKIGAIIVIEREGSVLDHVEKGVPLDAIVNKDLFTSIFLPVSPLHDGAVVVQGGRVIQAGCILPLSMNVEFTRIFGTRHLAAVGITEEVDAVVVIVSEETGLISIALDGDLDVNLDGMKLRKKLQEVFHQSKKANKKKKKKGRTTLTQHLKKMWPNGKKDKETRSK